MQIEREGSVRFGDAALYILEEGIGAARDSGGTKGANDWELQFKRQVFKRVIQQLGRIGWTVGPDEDAEKNYKIIAKSMRWCSKGDLKADLRISGRSIELKMFQSVNAPDRPDHDGRYQSDKEQHMPYVMRLEMERTRRRIRNYLCSVFTGYQFTDDKIDGRHTKVGVNGATALEFVEACYKTSWHFKGDVAKHPISEGNSKSRDGKIIEHGSKVYYTDWHGRVLTGTAYYNINNMWWIASGKYGYTNKATFEIYVDNPGDLRRKRNDGRREKRLTSEMEKAVKEMRFERAAKLRDILFPVEPSTENSK